MVTCKIVLALPGSGIGEHRHLYCEFAIRTPCLMLYYVYQSRQGDLQIWFATIVPRSYSSTWHQKTPLLVQRRQDVLTCLIAISLYATLEDTYSVSVLQIVAFQQYTTWDVGLGREDKRRIRQPVEQVKSGIIRTTMQTAALLRITDVLYRVSYPISRCTLEVGKNNLLKYLHGLNFICKFSVCLKYQLIVGKKGMPTND